MVKTITFFFIMPTRNAYCPLCCADESAECYFEDTKRQYLRCTHCELVYVTAEYLPQRQAELAEYQLHENDASDEGYRRFLQRCLTPLTNVIDFNPHMTAIDYGCGPTPVLAAMLESYDISVARYDPFFFPDKQVLAACYDIITCTEAIEHFHQPYLEWRNWLAMLKPNGVIAIMTKRVISQERFAQWHYKNDPTHVCFFSEATFRFLAKRDGFSLQFPSNDVVLMKKV